jgi:two-component system, NtrC family, response regulator AtoC
MSIESIQRVLVADDEPNLRKVLQALLRQKGFEVECAADGQEALALLQKSHFDAVVTDLRMPKLDGMGLLRHVLIHHREVPVIMITAHGTVDTAVEAIKLGAFDYITKPFEQEHIGNILRKAVQQRALAMKDAVHVKSSEELPGRLGIIGLAPSMRQLFSIIEKVASTPTTVLITGESGTGKELVARALFENSSRKDKPFIRLNCAAIPKELVESELFGYEKGAFTGAVSQKPGRFELADEGTLFLDEIGEIPQEMQVKLLRVLQEGEFERVGGVKTQKVDVRLIAATNRDLSKEISDGKFREDLYYRLNVVPIHIPPLRERREDIPPLIEHFRKKFNIRLGRAITSISPEAQQKLSSYHWQGNIRELENVMERMVLFCEGDTIQESLLPEEVRSSELAQPAKLSPTTSIPASGATLKEIVKESTARIERDLIAKALEETGGNVTRAAQKLKISRKGLQLKMKELGLRDEES